MAKINWEAHFRAQKASGLSVNKYCAKVSIIASSFYVQRRKHHNSEIKPARSQFAAIDIKEPRKSKAMNLTFSLDSTGAFKMTASGGDIGILRILFGGGAI